MSSSLYFCLVIWFSYATCVSAVDPKGVHLAFTGDPTQMVVSWFTSNNTTSSIVLYGSSSSHYSMQTFGTQGTYNASVGYYHNAILSQLKPFSRYYFICGDGNAMSAEYNFKTAPQQGAQDVPPFSIGIYGDLGIYGSENTRSRLKDAVDSEAIDFIYHLGDISYADDREPQEYESVWADFFDQMQPIMGFVPYMTAVGNNDRGCKKCKEGELPYARNFTTFKNRFRMPGPESGSGTNMYFSFNYGPIHFISISTETDYPGSPFGNNDGLQLKWLENDLMEANLPENRAQRPWIIVTGHRPIYSSILIYHLENSPVGQCRTLQEAFEGLFKKYSVDIFFNGHVHGYERCYPVYNDVLSKSYIQPSETIHIMSGAAGNIEGMDPWVAYSHLVDKPSWMAFRYIDSAIVDPWDYNHEGYGVLNVHNSTHLTWQFFRSSSNDLIDSVDIVNDHSRH